MRRMRTIALVSMVLCTALIWSFRDEARASEEQGLAGRGHAPIAWVGAVMTNVVYLPVKLVYAGTGGLVGGLAYLVTAGDAEAFYGVWKAAGGGTYLVTPSMLEGKDPVCLVGS